MARDEAAATARVKAQLVGALGYQRRHVLGILDGLDDDAMLRPVLPSGWSAAALVWHLAHDVERWWFRQVVGGEQLPEIDGWSMASSTRPAAVLDAYRAEVAAADAVVAATALGEPPARWPTDLWPDWRMDDLGEVMVHVITETACHAGHLDAARELIDGRQWLVLG